MFKAKVGLSQKSLGTPGLDDKQAKPCGLCIARCRDESFLT
jgi:hypothetical protein